MGAPGLNWLTFTRVRASCVHALLQDKSRDSGRRSLRFFRVHCWQLVQREVGPESCTAVLLWLYCLEDLEILRKALNMSLRTQINNKTKMDMHHSQWYCTEWTPTPYTSTEKELMLPQFSVSMGVHAEHGYLRSTGLRVMGSAYSFLRKRTFSAAARLASEWAQARQMT